MRMRTMLLAYGCMAMGFAGAVAWADKTVTVVSSSAQVTHGRFSLEKDGSVTLTVCGVATTAEGVAVEKGCTTAKVTGTPANTFRAYVNGASGLARWKTERGL